MRERDFGVRKSVSYVRGGHDSSLWTISGDSGRSDSQVQAIAAMCKQIHTHDGRHRSDACTTA